MGLLAEIRDGFRRAFRVREQYSGLIDPDDALYRPVTELGASQDPNGQLDYIRRERNRRLAPQLYFRDAVGGAVIDSQVDRVIGAGITFKAEDEKVQEVIDHFVSDPDNELDQYLELYAKELQVYGELVLPIFLTPENADVRLGYLDPWQVESVLFQRGNAKRALAVIQRAPKPGEKALLWVVPHPSPEYEGKYPPHPALTEENEGNAVRGQDGLPVLLPTDSRGAVLPEVAEALGRDNLIIGGYCFYHRNNSLVTGRGRSGYERIQDWLKGLNDFVFGVLRTAILSGLVFLKVTKEGASDADCRSRQLQLGRMPKPGSLFVTNEREQWEFLTAALPPAGPVKELLQGVLKLIGVATGIPPHEIGAEGDSNRSTAKEASAISANRAKRFQLTLTSAALSWITYQVNQKQYRGMLPESADTTITPQAPEIDATDQLQDAQALNFVVQGLTAAVDSQLVLKTDARQYLYGILGIDPPTDEEFAKAEAEARQQQDEAFMGGADGRLKAIAKQLGMDGQPGAAAGASANGGSHAVGH